MTDANGDVQPARICGARRRNGQPCHGKPMANGRCRLHGGTALRGVAASNFRTGRYSKYLPQDLRGRHATAVTDPQLLSLADELALLTTRAQMLLDRLRTTKIVPWGQALTALRAFTNARGAGDQEGTERAAAELATVMTAGQAAAAVHEGCWVELRELIQERTRTAAAEWKRLCDLKAVVTADQAVALARALMLAARDTVRDPVTLRALQDRMIELLPPPSVTSRATVGGVSGDSDVG